MDSSLPPIIQATSGAIGSVIGKTVVFPLDSVTTQSQHAKPRSNAHKLSVIATLQRLIKRRGVVGLYGGLKADVLSTLISSFLYFYLYSSLHKVALRVPQRSGSVSASPAGIGGVTAGDTPAKPRQLGALQELVIGVVAGVASKGLVLPISAVCVRQQLEADDKPSKSLLGTLRQIIKEDGVLGLWAALPPSVPIALLPSLTLYIHSVLLRLLVPASSRAHPPGYVTFALGAASNALATIPLYPMILLKVLSQSGEVKRSQVDTFDTIVRERGVEGLYQGIESQLVKGVISQGVMMLLKQRVEEGIVWAYRTFQ